MAESNWLDKLQKRWNLKSIKQVIIVLIVFACTGTTVLLIKNPILDFIGINDMQGWLKTTLYLIFVLPLYNLILLIYGALFGQFSFFWEFEKKTINRMLGRKKKKEDKKNES